MSSDEATRARLKTQARAQGQAHTPDADPASRELVQLTRAEALAFLDSVTLGRIVFTRGALPAIRPVNHALIDGQLVIRTHEGAALTAAAGQRGVVVAYEADAIDPDNHLGCSVVVTGFARLVTDPATLARYERLLQLDEITGFWLTQAQQEPDLGSYHTPPPP